MASLGLISGAQVVMPTKKMATAPSGYLQLIAAVVEREVHRSKSGPTIATFAQALQLNQRHALVGKVLRGLEQFARMKNLRLAPSTLDPFVGARRATWNGVPSTLASPQMAAGARGSRRVGPLKEAKLRGRVVIPTPTAMTGATRLASANTPGGSVSLQTNWFEPMYSL